MGGDCRSDELHAQPENVRLCASILVLPAGARTGWGHPKTFKFNWLGMATGISVVSQAP